MEKGLFKTVLQNSNLLKYWILVGETPIECSQTEWADQFNRTERILAADVINTAKGEVRVSTVFLGIDHGFDFAPDAVPVLFETMVFGGKYDGMQQRYQTYDQAQTGHAEACYNIRKGRKNLWP